MLVFFIVFAILLCCIPIGYYVWCYFDPLKTYEKEKSKEQEEREEEIRPSWEKLKKEYDKKVEYYESRNHFKSKFGDLYLFEDNKLICLNNLFSLQTYARKNSSFKLPKELEEIIDFKNVKYYDISGSEREKQIISGGGGGGSSVKGAIVGGLVAGDVGAIIGSRKKTETITTTYEKVDDRKLTITFQNGETKTIKDFKVYEYLLEHIPEMDYENYIKRLKDGRKK